MNTKKDMVYAIRRHILALNSQPMGWSGWSREERRRWTAEFLCYFTHTKEVPYHEITIAVLAIDDLPEEKGEGAS